MAVEVRLRRNLQLIAFREERDRLLAWLRAQPASGDEVHVDITVYLREREAELEAKARP